VLISAPVRRPLILEHHNPPNHRVEEALPDRQVADLHHVAETFRVLLGLLKRELLKGPNDTLMCFGSFHGSQASFHSHSRTACE
jgi:hypothetical protein